MNFLNIFEDHVSSIFGAARAPFSFKKLAKQAAREMEDQTLVVNGVNTAPALYTILVSDEDDPLLSSYYLRLAREVGEFVKAQAEKKRYTFVGEPLVRFMVDPELKGGKFSVFAENVDAPTLGRLYQEEQAYQASLSGHSGGMNASVQARQPMQQQAAQSVRPAQQVAQPQPVQQQPAQQQAAAAPQAAHAGNVAQLASSSARVAASIPQVNEVADPFAPAAAFDQAAAIPVPQTMDRAALAGLGSAAAAGSVAANMVGSRAAQPQAPARPMAQLVDVVTGDIYDVTRAQCVIGRERASSDIALSDPNISRQHAQLTYNGSDWTIEDLGSTNGTMVNNRRVTRCPLRNGDLLTFALSTFEFRG